MKKKVKTSKNSILINSLFVLILMFSVILGVASIFNNYSDKSNVDYLSELRLSGCYGSNCCGGQIAFDPTTQNCCTGGRGSRAVYICPKPDTCLLACSICQDGNQHC